MRRLAGHPFVLALVGLVVFSLTASLVASHTGGGAQPAATPCALKSPVRQVVYLVFDNVHLTRDDPNVPSDLEQMPHLLDFIRDNGALLTNHHTPLIAH